MEPSAVEYGPFEGAVGRLFTDEQFRERAVADPEGVAQSFELDRKDLEGFKDLIDRMRTSSAVDLADWVSGAGHGCSSGSVE